MTESLVAFDTDKIKDYIFATGTLKEIRGASALLDRLNRESMPDLVAGEQVYANGGGGLFRVPEDETETAIQSVRCHYQQETYSVSVTGANVALSVDARKANDHLALLRHRLHLAKGGGTEADVYPLTNPLLRFCESCGVRYAQIVVDSDYLCHSCHRKRQENQTVTESIEQWTSGNEPPNTLRLWGRLIQMLSEQNYPVAGYHRPEDFDELGSQSVPSNTMGIIYADGDGMGRLIETIESLSEYKRFAEAVDEAVYRSVTDAIHVHLQPENRDTWPFDVLLLGGDDLVLITRSQSALAVALHIVERFPQLTKELWGEPLNLSASVVLAQVKYPIGSLIRLAESGLKFAKQQAARRRLAGETFDGGLINFLVVNSANHLEFNDYYRQVLKRKEYKNTLYRTKRPYSASQMKMLLHHIQTLKEKKVSYSKLEQLRAATFKSRRQGTLDAMMSVLRVRNDEQREALLALVSDLPTEQVYLPWARHGETDWITPVVDIVELMDFVG